MTSHTTSSPLQTALFLPISIAIAYKGCKVIHSINKSSWEQAIKKTCDVAKCIIVTCIAILFIKITSPYLPFNLQALTNSIKFIAFGAAAIYSITEVVTLKSLEKIIGIVEFMTD
ncbi:hypothetical protein K0U07_00385 [bacterium]|nr:hypothetical protein [bacterium]